MTQYTPEQVGELGKVWQITEDSSGLVYMASDHGLIEFDGSNWRKFKGSKGVNRSILYKEGALYTGSDSDFGKWSLNEGMDWVYKSLYPYAGGELTESEEFWNVFALKDYVLFISNQNIYVHYKEKITKIALPDGFSGCAIWEDKLYISAEDKLFSFDGMGFSDPIRLSESIQLIGIFESSKGKGLVTRQKGVWLWDTQEPAPADWSINEDLQSNQVFTFTTLSNGDLVFGTIRGGVLITNPQGNIVHLINRKKGLINQTILSSFYSNSGFLWLSLDYGIVQIQTNSAFGYVFDDLGNFGNPKTALLVDDILYLGTNQGLYFIDWSQLTNSYPSLNFSFVPNTLGQVWTLRLIDGVILCGHDKGLFKIENGTATLIEAVPGVWDILPYGKSKLLTGNYDGVHLFEKEGADWAYSKRLEGLVGSCNQLEREESGPLWVKIPNFGIVKVTLDASLSVVERSNFYFDSLDMQNPELSFGKDGLYLLEDSTALLFHEATQSFRNYDPLKTEPSHGLNLDSTYSFTVVEGGFQLRQKSTIERKYSKAPILVRSISSIEGDQFVRVNSKRRPSLSAEHCLVEVAVPQYGDAQFRYQLDDSNQWSNWMESGKIRLFNLSSGSHQLAIEAKYGDDFHTRQLFEFSIVTPWYLSKQSIFLYVLLVVAIGALLYFLQSRVQKRKEKRIKDQMFVSKKQAVWREERQSILMDKKNLEREISELEQKVKDKSVELAKKAKESDDKNKILDQLKGKLVQWKSAKGASKEVSEMLRLIDNFIQLDDKTFEIQIDELQQDFYKNLKEAYPELSTYDLRLCAYVKLGLSSKEIAQIQGVLPSSVNVSRSRLRKKLDLDTGDDLFDTLNQF